MLAIVTHVLLTVALASQPYSEWVPLRWEAANGPRDVEFLQPSVKVVSGVLSVSVRRDRAVALKQDPTIAPETYPWTAMDLQVNCVQAKWRVVSTKAVDDSGEVISSLDGEHAWQAVEPATLAAALRARLCPSA